MNYELRIKNKKTKEKKTSKFCSHTSYFILHTSLGGFSVVEVIIGSSLILLAFMGLTTAYSFYIKAGLKNTDGLKAVFLMQEGVEAVTLIRDESWSTFSALSTTTSYYLSWNGTKWVSTTTASLIDSVFTRTFKLEEVYRRTSDSDIVATSSPDAKALDTDTRRLTVKVTAPSRPTISKQVVTYLTNLFE